MLEGLLLPGGVGGLVPAGGFESVGVGDWQWIYRADWQRWALRDLSASDAAELLGDGLGGFGLELGVPLGLAEFDGVPLDFRACLILFKSRSCSGVNCERLSSEPFCGF